MNLRVRGRLVLLCALLAGGVPAVAQARPRASVPTFTVARGAEGLSHFQPAVTRAVAQALAESGVEVGPGGETAVVGRVEELGDDRVRLSAAVHGRTVSVEGPIDALDSIAAQLAGRLAPMLGGSEEKATHAAAPAATAGRKVPVQIAKGTVAVDAKPAPAPSAAPATPAASTPPPASTAPAPAKESPPPAPVATPAKETPAAPPPPATAPAPAPTTTSAPPPVVSARPSDDEEESPARTPPRATGVYQPPARTASAYPPPAYGWVRGRVVAHAVADIPNAFTGAGQSATQALYYFLRGRLKLSVIPTGYGLAPPNIAADEGWRSGARAVVMARIQGIEYRPNPAGQSVVTRLEIIVVRDGRIVLRKIVESAPTDPGPVGLRRNRVLEDPMFSAITQSLESIVSDLNFALADVR
jgi:hypothetical protein